MKLYAVWIILIFGIFILGAVWINEISRHNRVIFDRNLDTFEICIETKTPDECSDLVYGKRK